MRPLSSAPTECGALPFSLNVPNEDEEEEEEDGADEPPVVREPDEG